MLTCNIVGLFSCCMMCGPPYLSIVYPCSRFNKIKMFIFTVDFTKLWAFWTQIFLSGWPKCAEFKQGHWKGFLHTMYMYLMFKFGLINVNLDKFKWFYLMLFITFYIFLYCTIIVCSTLVCAWGTTKV